mmetsp:Transcript_41184/g.90419  ORF Transcript_41184/g.90419 Transcript_41184/m.90419 type:complete len:205 (-) Transcript_41184:89-703(-)
MRQGHCILSVTGTDGDARRCTSASTRAVCAQPRCEGRARCPPRSSAGAALVCESSDLFKGALQHRLDVSEGDEQECAIVLAREEHPAFVANVEFVEVVDELGKVDHGASLLVDLLEHGVAEEAEQVAVAVLAPLGVIAEDLTLLDELELGKKAQQPPVLHLLAQLRLQGVDEALRLRDACHHPARDERHRVVHGRAATWRRRRE